MKELKPEIRDVLDLVLEEALYWNELAGRLNMPYAKLKADAIERAVDRAVKRLHAREVKVTNHG